MPVSLPTAADVRKARDQAAKNAEAARTPLLAVLGAGDYAVTTARTLPQRLTSDELRKTVADLREQAENTYEGFAERGEKAWGRLRRQPQVRQAIATIESYTEQLDARVDTFVEDAHDVAEKALATVTRQTRSTGEKVARTTQKVAVETAQKVTEVAKEGSAKVTEIAGASDKVAAKVAEKVTEAGEEVASDLTEAGDEAAHTTRSVTRKAAIRTAPRTTPRKPANRSTSGSAG